MKKCSPVLLSLFVLSACGHLDVRVTEPPAEQAPPAASVEPPAGPSGLARRCTAPAGVEPVWWRDGATHAHFGCATAHNAALQHVPLQPAAATGIDGVIATSAAVRYRKGRVAPLREPSVEVGGQ